jgi:RHS repeat-associated protein
MFIRTYISYSDYRYGFNGMEKDDEVKGAGNSYDFGARMHDTRLGRFLSIDPLSHDNYYESNYSYAANNPIYYIDILGLDNIVYLIAIPTSEGKNDAEVDCELIAKEANLMYEKLGLKTLMVVFKGSKADFKSELVDKTDSYVISGNYDDLNNIEGVNRPKYKDNTGRSQYGLTGKSDQWCSINESRCGDAATKLGKSKEYALAFISIHETTHIAGISHHTIKDNLDNPENILQIAQSGGILLSSVARGDQTAEEFLNPNNQPGVIAMLKKKYEDNDASVGYYTNARYSNAMDSFNEAYSKVLKSSGSIVEALNEGLNKAYESYSKSDEDVVKEYSERNQ